MNDKKLQIVISALDKASAPIKWLGNTLKGLGEVTAGVSRQIAGLAKVGAVALAGLGAYGIKLAGDIEQTSVAFQNLYGNAEQAGATMKKLSDFAAKTPFEFPELADTALKLKNVAGIADKDLIPLMTSLGDIAASQSKSISQTTEAFNDAITGEFERLKEFGIKAKQDGDKVSFTFRNQTVTVAKTSEAIGEYLNKLGQAKGIAGAMEMQSNTLNGRLSTLKDTFSTVLKGILGVSATGEITKGGIFDRVSQSVKGLIDFLEANQGKIIAFFNGIATLVSVSLNALFAVITGFSGDTRLDFQALFQTLKQVAQSALAAISAWWSKYGNDIIIVAKFVFGLIKSTVTAVMNGIVPVIKNALAVIGNLFSFFSNLIQGNWGKAWGNLKEIAFNALLGIWNLTRIFLDTIARFFGSSFEQVKATLLQFAENVGKVFLDLVDSAKQWGENLIDMLVQGLQNGVEKMGKASLDLAQQIKNNLGFGSPTKEGPGKNSDKWMPNLMDMLVDGLSETSKIEQASANIAAMIGKGLSKDKLAELAQDLKDTVSNASEAIKSAFEDVSSKATAQKDKVAGLKTEYAGLKEKLKEIGTEGKAALDGITKSLEEQRAKVLEVSAGGKTEVASRALKIEEELKALKEAQALEKTKEGQEAIKLLEAELELAKAYAGAEAIGLQRIENGKSETRLIIDRTAKRLYEAEQERMDIQKTLDAKILSIETEKAAVTAQMEAKRIEIQTEYALYKQMIRERQVLEGQYFDAFKVSIKYQIDKTKEAIALMAQLNAKTGGQAGSLVQGARALGGPVSANRSYLVGENGPEIFSPGSSGKISNGTSSAPIVTINMGGVTVNGEADENRLVDKIRRALIRETELYSNGIA